MKGHCLCGAVRFEYDSIKWAGYCHCASCRRNCASPVTAFFGVKDGDWRWTGDEPATFSASDHATRWFCEKCGTPMAYASTRFADEIHFYAATLENPELFVPTQHFHHGEHLSWLVIDDDLKRHRAGSLDD